MPRSAQQRAEHEARVRAFSEALVEAGGNATAACLSLGIPIGNRHNLLLAVRAAGLPDGRDTAAARAAPAAPEVPLGAPLPEPDVPIDEIIAIQRRRFEAAHAHQQALQWRRYTVPHRGPYALFFFGDPHIDDNGCNWPLLEQHIELSQALPGIYAINVGDVTNNWAGRLARLWAQQDTSGATARRLAKWLLSEAGVPWFLWLHGNHDGWDGPVGDTWFEAVRPHYVQMHKWQAKITLVAPCGHELRLWAAHDFPGHSQWNPMHGPVKAAQMADWAHIYVAGHRHIWGLAKGEHEHRRFCYDLVRVRGYKYLDDYATQLGYGAQAYGASVLAVVRPDAGKQSVVTCFADPEAGIDYLRFLRGAK